MYNHNRLEWHQGDERQKRIKTPQGTVWSCRVVSDWDFSLLTNRFPTAHAKSQDHRASCGVFAFGRRNAVRRWLRLRYPDTRASQIGERGLSPRARWLKQSGTVRCDDMAPKSKSQHRRTLVLTTVRLCFAPTFTKKQMNTRG